MKRIPRVYIISTRTQGYMWNLYVEYIKTVECYVRSTITRKIDTRPYIGLFIAVHL